MNSASIRLMSSAASSVSALSNSKSSSRTLRCSPERPQATSSSASVRGRLPEIARDCLRTRGFQTTSLSSARVVERALQTTSDFPLLLADTVKDALSLPRNHWRDRDATGEDWRARVLWPVPAALDAILRAAPRHDAVTLCASSTRRPWTLDGLRASWRTFRIRLENDGGIGPGLTLYGLRHTVAVILREAGHDERTIADALGQRTFEMARHYAKGADLRGKMRGVVASFDAELNRRRTKVVKPDRKNCQTFATDQGTKEMMIKNKHLLGSGGALPPFPTTPKHTLLSPITRLIALP
jgi:hypothetical protein